MRGINWYRHFACISIPEHRRSRDDSTGIQGRENSTASSRTHCGVGVQLDATLDSSRIIPAFERRCSLLEARLAVSASPGFLSRLAALAAPPGGWGYHAGKASHPEPTCLALLALSTARDQFAESIGSGLASLDLNHHPDGSYRLTDGRPEAGWPTAIALFTKLALGAAPREMTSTIERILSVESRVLARDPETTDMENDIDLSLVGWPWAATNFGWVEPTSWACLALRAAGLENHPRVQQGLKLLLDRAFDSGGANYGNRVVLGTATEPIPGPSAILLVAVQGGVDHPRIDAAVGYLRMHATRATDLEHLAWAKIALSIHDSDTATRELFPELDRKIIAAASDPGTSPHRLALAALARCGNQPIPAAVRGARIARGSARRGRSKFAGTLRQVRVKGSRRDGCGDHQAQAASTYFRRAHCPRAFVRRTARGDPRSQFAHFRETCPLAGKRVVLKPNLVEYRPDRVINTDPRVVDAVITLCKKKARSRSSSRKGRATGGTCTSSPAKAASLPCWKSTACVSWTSITTSR